MFFKSFLFGFELSVLLVALVNEFFGSSDFVDLFLVKFGEAMVNIIAGFLYHLVKGLHTVVTSLEESIDTINDFAVWEDSGSIFKVNKTVELNLFHSFSLVLDELIFSISGILDLLMFCVGFSLCSGKVNLLLSGLDFGIRDDLGAPAAFWLVVQLNKILNV